MDPNSNINYSRNFLHGHFGQALNVLLDFAQENQHWAHGNCVMKVNVLGHSMLRQI